MNIVFDPDKDTRQKIADEKEIGERWRSYEEITKLIKEEAYLCADIGDDYKELIAEALMEKYDII